jgi:serine phosphatase RsbU (regulator of sigma subunit)
LPDAARKTIRHQRVDESEAKNYCGIHDDVSLAAVLTNSSNVNASAAGIRDRIESSLTKFAQGTSAADDITLVIVKRQAEAKLSASAG